MIRRFTLSLLNLLWKTAAILVVTVALLVTAVRLLLPEINRYREPIAEWVSRQVSQPVEFDSINASWRGWIPVVELSNVRLRTMDGDQTITRFANAQFSLDPLRSLKRREIVPGNMVVSGMQVSLARSEDGSIRIEGAGADAVGESGLQQNALAYWLQTQRNLTIEEAAITWHDERLLKPLIFSNVTLQIRSDGQRQQLEGRAHQPDSPDGEFRFLLDVRGDLLTTTWSGELYLQGRGIEPSTLLEYRRWLGLEAQGGQLDFRFWSNWRNARLVAVNGMFTAGGSEVGTRAQRIRLKQLQGNVVAERAEPGGWRIAVSPLEVETTNGAWPDTRIDLDFQRGEAGKQQAMQVNVGYVKLADVMPVVNDISALPANMREALLGLSPRGNLREVRVQYNPGDRSTLLNLAFDELSVAAEAKRPGIEGLAGTLAADNSGGHVKLDSRGVTLAAPAVYNRPVAIDTLQGEVAVTRRDRSWHLVTDGLTLANADLRTTVYGTVDVDAGQAPNAQLFARIDHLAPPRIAAYLPASGIGEKSRNWWSHAFAGGRVNSGALVLRGPLDRFPFDDREGRFELRLAVTGAEVLFSEKWPLVREMDADVVLAGRRLTVHSSGAKTLDVALSDTTTRIADVFAQDQILLINGHASGTIPAAKEYVRHTPLQEKFEEAMKSVADAGKIDVELDLNIPLGPPPTEVKGSARLSDAALKADALGEGITGLDGTVTFTRSTFETKDLEGDYAGLPVVLGFKGATGEGTKDLELSMRGDASADWLNARMRALAPAVAHRLGERKALDQIRGTTDWEIAATVQRGKATRLAELRFRSSLAGMALALPSPLRKEAAVAWPLNVRVDMQEAAERRVTFDLGEELNGALLFRKTGARGMRFARAALQFGDSPARLPSTDSVQIAGTMSQLSINDWLDVLHERSAAKDSIGPGNTSAPPLPVTLDVTAGRVETLGRHFDNVHLRGDSGTDAWQLHVAGAQLEGDVTIPHQLHASTTDVQLQRLHIPRRADEKTASVKVNPARLPAVNIRCEDFAYQDVNFGRAELTTQRIADGLKLESLTFNSPASSITTQGEWMYVDGVHTSRFSIRVESEELARLLTQFQYGVTAVEGGKTAINIAASWGGSPADFTLEKLRGSLGLTIKDGRFLDVDNPAAGRLFGLLSLQALPRRLTLDFNDLFKKGMSFEQIAGTFELEDGNAYTNNLVMQGSSANVEITGRIGLAGQDYDQLATVTPQISDSLPVASALFGPVGAAVGAGIFLGKQIIPELPEQIDKIVARQYTITGSWNDPIVEQVQSRPPPTTNTPLSADG